MKQEKYILPWLEERQKRIARKKELQRARNRRYYLANRDKVIARSLTRYAEHRDDINAKRRQTNE